MSTITARIEAEATTCVGLSDDLRGTVKNYFLEGLTRIQNTGRHFLFDPIYEVYRGFSFCVLFLCSNTLFLYIVVIIQQILTLIKHYVFASLQAMLDKCRFSLRPPGLRSINSFQDEWSGLLKGSFISRSGVVDSKSSASSNSNSNSRVSDSMSNLKNTLVSPGPDDGDGEKRQNSEPEEFTSHKKPKYESKEQFTAFTSRTRKSSHNPNDIVQKDDEFIATIHTSKITVTGSEVLSFTLAHERKIRDYNDKPYYKLLSNGVMSKKRRTFEKYVLGAAICKRYSLDVRRFIEAQYYYHDNWQGEAPSISYVVSLDSSWNSVGRYKSYCEKFKTELNYFDAGVDNVDQAYHSKPKEVKIDTPNSQMVQIYEEMIEHQMLVTGLSRKQVLWVLGHPETGYIPWQYLKSLPLYQELVEEQAWGMEGKKMGFYKKIKSYRE
tara:strand:- start:6716 stop:8026 length:1311 start_codon:yes stop_codon:yes gene_type:complete